MIVFISSNACEQNYYKTDLYYSRKSPFFPVREFLPDFCFLLSIPKIYTNDINSTPDKI